MRKENIEIATYPELIASGEIARTDKLLADPEEKGPTVKEIIKILLAFENDASIHKELATIMYKANIKQKGKMGQLFYEIAQQTGKDHLTGKVSMYMNSLGWPYIRGVIESLIPQNKEYKLLPEGSLDKGLNYIVSRYKKEIMDFKNPFVKSKELGKKLLLKDFKKELILSQFFKLPQGSQFAEYELASRIGLNVFLYEIATPAELLWKYLKALYKNDNENQLVKKLYVFRFCVEITRTALDYAKGYPEGAARLKNMGEFLMLADKIFIARLSIMN